MLKLDSSRSGGESKSEVNTPTNRPQSPTKKKRSKEAPEIGASKKKTVTAKRAKSAAPSAYRRLMQQVRFSTGANSPPPSEPRENFVHSDPFNSAYAIATQWLIATRANPRRSWHS